MPSLFLTFIIKAIILFAFVCVRELLVNDKNNRFTKIKKLFDFISTLSINTAKEFASSLLEGICKRN